MLRYFRMLLVGILVSMFLFPFEFSFLPGVNTKMAMAGVGLVVVVFYLLRKRQPEIPQTLLGVILCCSSVSLIGFVSTTYNNTHDYTYTTYIVSASVWLSAAFVVYNAIKHLHGRIDYKMLITYLTSVCVVQCILALVIDNVPAVQQFVDRWVLQGQYFLHRVHRLYGIGASLDVAGLRFASVLSLISLLLNYENKGLSELQRLFFVFSYILIFVVGSIIARTTVVGLLGIGLALVFHFGIGIREHSVQVKKNPIVRDIVLLVAVAIPICVALYNHSRVAHSYMRFGFEGFFSLVETGEWHTTSNDTLEGMVVLPDNLKTWIIGDGYFESARNDINFLGDTSLDTGYYMGTDIGYLRFVFYFGIVGMLAMVMVMVYTAIACSKEDENHKLYSWSIVLIGLIVWMKVSTDIFGVLCLLLCVANADKTQDEEGLEEEDYTLAP